MIKMTLTKEQLTELKAGNSIPIPMELKECECIRGVRKYTGHPCGKCNGTGQVSKYQVGDVIKINIPRRKSDDAVQESFYTDCYIEQINLKIISINTDKKTMDVVQIEM